ncbi:MAG: putative ATP-dependent helicase DinG [bacterium]|nr:putative ATP-dependent helicase DinG [bacterium]
MRFRALAEEITRFFGEEGTLSLRLPRHEFRPEQLTMAHAVAEAANGKKILMLEAGTGVGKSLAYLVPLILKAVAEEKRVFVATGTKTLQHQLMEKELPFLKRHLGVDFNFALCLGAENYLCERRLAAVPTTGQEELFADLAEVANIRTWAEGSRGGLRSEIEFPVSNATWHQVCRVSELCAGQDCGRGGECFYQKARRRQTYAQVLVANHHLLFANLMADWEYLPECQILVIDEAHTLDSTASDCLGIEFSYRALRRVFEGLRGKDGKGCLVGSLIELPIEQRLGLLDRVRFAEQRFLETLIWLHDKVLEGEPRVAVSRETAALGLEHFIEPLSEVVAGLKQILKRIEREETRVECEGYVQRLQRTLAEAKQVAEMPEDAPWLLWCEELAQRGRGLAETSASTAFHATPIEPAEILKEKLYPRFESTILVSATLSTGGDFRFVADRLGTHGAETLSLPSPFDTKNNLMVYLPAHVPEPARFEEYTAEVNREVIELVQAASGGTFVLCTSYKVLNALHDLFRNSVPCEEYGARKRFERHRKSSRLLVMRQGDASRERMLEAFRSAGRAVLFGAATFWQGVDVPGRDLEMVIITRLPFQSPDDPVLEAKIRLCRERGGDPFNDIQVPHAVMQFRQGLGRLIRSKSDRGVVAILDSRVNTKGYGRAFLNALPECRQTDKLEEAREFLRGVWSDK